MTLARTVALLAVFLTAAACNHTSNVGVDYSAETANVQECNPNTPCPSGSSCFNGACSVSCGMNYPNVQCPAGETCQNSHCLPAPVAADAGSGGSCSATANPPQCPTGSSCVNGTCSVLCGVNYPNVQCPQGQTCRNSHCLP